MRLSYYDLDQDRVVEVDRGRYLYEDELRGFRFSWSPDSRWLAYARAVDNLKSAAFLFDTAAGQSHQVTSGYYSASHPFGAGGEYLFLFWDRALVPSYSDYQSSWIYANATHIAAVPLRQDVPSPLAPRNDEEGERDDDDDDDSEDDNGERPIFRGPVEIDLEGFESRLVVLPPEPGNFGGLEAVPGRVIYHRLPRTGALAEIPRERAGSIVAYDLEKRREKTVVEDVHDFVLASGGRRILPRRGEDFAILKLRPQREFEDALPLDEMEMTVDPAAEWRQIFTDAWSFERDYFYDPGLHGVDWEEMRRRYGALLEDAVTRWDVNFVIGELIGELIASHVYRGGGDVEEGTLRGTGLLGADFELDGGAYRIADIVDLLPWETEVRSPLRQPGVAVAEGDYLLAVNGTPVDASRDPWAAFAGMAGETVALTVNDRPTFEGARQVLVETLESETRLRNLAWMEANHRRVEEASGGRVGYVYVPDTGLRGQSELVRQLTAELAREGLIVDERFNSGGQIPDRFIELLNRPALNYWGVRDGVD